jgi:hypothetical protein
MQIGRIAANQSARRFQIFDLASQLDVLPDFTVTSAQVV